MSLRTRTLLILAISLILALTILSFSLRKLLDSEFTKLENREVQEHTRRVELALENASKQLSSKATDWAQWDDTYKFMLDKNEDYLHSNISFETLSAISVSHVVYRSIDGLLVKGYEVDYISEKVNSLSNEAQKILAESTSTLAGSTPEAIKSGFILVDNKPYIYAAIPIFDSRRAEVCRGSLLFSIALDQKFTDLLAEQTRLKIRLLSIPELVDSKHLDINLIKSSKIPVAFAISNDEIRGYELLRDTEGTELRVIEVSLDRAIFMQGQDAVRYLISSLLIVMILTLVVSGFSINKWILNRLSHLQKQVSTINTKKLEGERINLKGNDELASLGSTINSFLYALEESQKLTLDARAKAERANAAKSMFIARVSHELRNPIHGIRGINDLILKRESSKAVHDLVKMGDDAAEGLLSIVDEILDFSKAESGELAFEKIDYDIRQVVRDALQVASARLQGKYKNEKKEPVQLAVEIDPEVPLILKGDPTRLRQVLVNLLTNSVKFTEYGYVGLKISAKIENDTYATIKFDIWDTGIGIPDDKVSSLFQPFKQVDESITRKYQGSGLGLSIVKQFTEGLGGSITVTSILGKGSTFSVSLPQTISENNRSILQINVLNKQFPTKSILVAPSSPVYTALESTFKKLGVPLTIVNCTNAEQAQLAEEKLISADLLIFSEEAWKNSTIQSIIKKGSSSNKQCRVALVRHANLELRESLYEIGIKHVLSLPVLADDIINAYTNKILNSTKQNNEVSPESKLNKKLRVLIADDAPTNRLILQEMLEDEGHSVVQVGDGKEILNLITPMLNGESNAEHFDLIITDITMPLMNGDEATRAIRNLESKNSNGVHVPIVAITGHAFGNEQELIRQAGVDGILTKPMRPENLLSELTRLFQQEPLK